jgi:hypothetical protein
VRRALIAVLVLSIALLEVPALAYDNTGSDPDDRRPVGSDPDLRSTRRLVWRGDDGRRLLRVGVQAYEPFGLWWFVDVALDSRGDRGTDYIMEIWNADNSGRGCSVNPRGRPGQAVRGRFRQFGDRTTCRVPLALVEPTKRVRWKLHSPSGYGSPGEADFAPNDLTFYP